MRRATLIFVGVFAIALLLSAVTLSWLLASESGLRFLVARVVALAPAEVSYSDVRGNFLGEMIFTDVKIEEAGPEIRIDQVSTSLSPAALLRGKITLQGTRLKSVLIRITSDEADGSRRLSAEGNAVVNAEVNPEGATSFDGVRWAFPEPLLPFELEIHDLEISDLRVASGEQETDEHFAIRRLSAAELRFGDAAWSVAGLEIDADRFSGAGEMSYAAGADHSLSFNFKSQLQVNEKYLEIDTKLSGNDELLELSQKFGGLLQGEISGALRDPINDARWSLAANLASDEPQAVLSELPPGALRMSVNFDGQQDTARIKGTAGGVGQEGGFEFEAQLESLLAGALVRSFSLRETGSDAQISFSGELRPLGAFPAVDGELTWSALRWPLTGAAPEAVAVSRVGVFKIAGEAGRYQLSGEAELESEGAVGTFTSRGEIDVTTPQTSFSLHGAWDRMQINVAPRVFTLESGHYAVAGNLDNYKFEAGFTASTENSPDVTLQLNGRGSQAGLELAQLVADSAAGSLRAQGKLALSGARDFEFSLETSGINTGAFDARWPGRVSMQGTGSGRLDQAGANARFKVGKLRGQLRALPLDASGHATFSDGVLADIDISGTWGESQLLARGKLGEQRDLRWQLNIPGLSSYTDRGSGSLASEGRLLGTPARPDVEGTLEVRGLKYMDIEAGELDITARLDATDSESSSLRAVARAVSWKDESVDELSLDVLGTAAAHSGALKIVRADMSLQTRFSGKWLQERWRGELSDTAVSFADTVWQQESPATLAASKSGLTLGESCLVQIASRVCLRAALPSGGSPDLALTMIALPVADLSTFLPPGLGYAGSISGEAKLIGGEGSARFDVSAARVWQDVANEEQVLLDYQSMSAVANLADNRLALELTGVEPGQQEVSFTANLPFSGWEITDGPLRGRIQGGMENLGAIAFLFPDLADLSGRLEADLTLSGTTAAPVWTGEVVLSDGNALVPSLGVGLTSISARLQAAGRQISGEINATSGTGSLSLSGSGEPGMKGMRGRFELRGDSFLASDLPEARLILSPELAITVDGRAVTLDGKVRIEEARIEPRDLSNAVQRSTDARVISPSGEPVPDESWAITSRVSVSLSDKVFFRGFGLESRVAGSLTVIDAPDAVTTATGELETIDGTYEVYGRELVIRRGRLLFGGGPLANPGLDVMATRTIDAGTEVGVLVRATLKSPQITLYSEPSMPPSQILSYLLVGQPLADIGSADRQLVNDTATRLASAGGGLLAQQLGRRLGLEDVTIASASNGEQAALVIGKYLSPKLYASYGVGLFEPVNTLRLRYLLSSKWTVRAESGLNQSVDLEYTLER